MADSDNMNSLNKPDTTQTLSNKKLALALSGIIMSILLAALDQTIVNPAMPRIVKELQGFSLYSWVTTAYLLTSTATILIAGKLGDMFGRKTVLLSGVFIFLIGSALSGASPSMFWLVMFRGLQGIGAGALQSNAFAIIAELFPDSAKRARWQGFIAAAFGLSSVIGPALGGYITDNLAWNWVFYVNLPVGVVAIFALIFTLPRSHATGRRKIDWWGATLIIGAVVSLLLALTWGGKKEPQGFAWDSPQILGLFGIGIILTALFIFVESKVQEPILPLGLFKYASVRAVAVISFTLGAVMLGATLYIQLFMQVVLGQSASSAGAVSTPLALALVTANILTGQFIGRVGLLKLPFISGAIVTLIGVGLLTTLNAASPVWVITLFLIVLGFGLGLIMPSMTIAVQETISRRELGVGISSVQFFRSIGSTVGVAIIGTIVANNYASGILADPSTKSLTPKLLEVIQEPQNLLDKQVAASLPSSVVGAVHSSLVDAIHSGFYITLGFAVVTLIAALLIPNIRIKSDLKRKKAAESATIETLTDKPVEVEIPLAH